ncbi:MAG: serine--tRNA ligase, partial [Kiritimatiellia bacterium]
MLDIKRIRENFDEVAEGLRRRGASLEGAERARDLDARRRALVMQSDELKTLRNSRSKEIGALKKAGQDTAAVQADVRAIGDQITALDAQLREIETDLEAAMLLIPNVPCATIPTGPDASANRVARVVGEPPAFAFKP